ncbi:DMT family transporter [Antarcticibacterium sp. 1MA-6-2]|uniref:DMT family transporter n=1 Tax=Antarcticibacterium sp. 1MA-6-2 TaxID=2908210 RepID=UPI001F40C20F|nr:DMT family transporter [Antarcticibacterium sp. 1MA-6-2]UJH90279.1 DMT family transporter [Antarcticibacterium sp. 1MA-6-2]
MNKRSLAIMAAIMESTIYGLNHTIAKAVMPEYVKPFGFIFLRVTGAAILFWLVSLWFPKEKIANSDWPRLIAATVCGMVINMLLFFKGLSLSTPINSSVIMTISPILVLLLSSYLLKERITLLKVIGIIISLSGALILILFSAEQKYNAPNIPLGNLLFLINAFSFGIYLILVKPLAAKYHPITLMKWLFLCSFLINFPITFWEFRQIEWESMPPAIWGSIAFVILGTTFSTYLLNIFAIKQLAASTLSSFIYLQPLIAIVFSVAVGADQLNLLKIVAGSLIFLGVYLVTKKKTVTGS